MQHIKIEIISVMIEIEDIFFVSVLLLYFGQNKITKRFDL